MQVFKLLSVSFRNLYSYGNVMSTVKLDVPGTTSIVGVNNDSGDGESQGSNGTGKSTIIKALTYGLFGVIIGNYSTLDKLINATNKKQLEVIVEFVGIDQQLYKVHRMRKMKAGADGNRVHIYQWSDDINQFKDITPTSADVDKLVAEKLGCSFDLFSRIVVFTASVDGYLNLKPSKQVEIIEELLGYTILGEKAEILSKEVIKPTKQALQEQKSLVERLVNDKQSLERRIIQAEQKIASWVTTHSQEISSLTNKKASIESIDFDYQEQIFEQLTTEQSKQTQLKQDKKIEQQLLDTVLIALNNSKDELKALLDNKCPYCYQEYASSIAKISKLQAKIKTLEESSVQSMEHIQSVDVVLRKLGDKIIALNSKLVVPTINQLYQLKNDSNTVDQLIASTAKQTNPYAAVLTELSELHAAINIDYSEVNKLEKLLEHQQLLLKLLTKSDSFVRKRLVDKNLKFLNSQLKKYLTVLGLPYEVAILDDLTTTVKHRGNDIDSANLSTGQLARINFAVSIAFKDVRERRFGKSNVIMFDEVLDYGLDVHGVTACAKIIKTIARDSGTSVFVITHRNEIDTMFDHKLVVTFEQGFSKITQQ